MLIKDATPSPRNRGSISGRGQRVFSTSSTPVVRPIQPPSQCLCFLGGKAAGAWSSPLTSSAEVKNEWSYIFTVPYAFVAWCLIRHTDNFTRLPKVRIVCTFLNAADWLHSQETGCPVNFIGPPLSQANAGVGHGSFPHLFHFIIIH